MMDFKSSNQKDSSTCIPYVRARDGSDDVCKTRPCLSCFFKNKMSCIAALFSVISLICFVLMLIYVNIQSADGYPTFSFIEVVKEPMTLQGPRSTMNPSVTVEIDGRNIWPENDFVRQKRQAPNMPDCRGRQEECRIVLEGVRDITKGMNERMDRLHKTLVREGILKDTDPKDAKFRKIVECLQCRNAIGPQPADEGNDVEPGFPFKRQRNDEYRIKDLFPFFESHSGYRDSNEDEAGNKSEERSERVPKTPPVKQVMESVTNNSRITHDGRVTEILHNTTIIEKDDKPKESATTGMKKYTFHHRPVQVPEEDKREESQVTRNMDATPILPTAETTKTSQQIQFMSPQSGWPTIPVCFYGPPSSSNSYQFKQGGSGASQFFVPYGAAGMNPSLANQPGNFFANGQPQFPGPTQFSPIMPQQFQPASPTPTSQFPLIGPSPQQPFPQPGQQQQQNFGYYCTYVPAPMNYQQQQQQLPFGPYQFAYSNPFIATAKNNERQEKAKGKIKPEQKQQASKSDPQLVQPYESESDESTSVKECAGFLCNSTYKKCIPMEQRCDGRVDCLNAEDELNCPASGYYARFGDPKSNNRVQVFNAPTDDQQPAMGVDKDMTRPESSDTVPPTNPSLFPFTDSQESNSSSQESEVETTTYNIVVPDMPERFVCKRIIQTISMEQRCDNVFDCEDTSDEEDCSCKEYLQIQHPSAICDGRIDCYDGSDETKCDICNDNQYYCHRSGNCIPKRERCNGVKNCDLNEDELDCYALTDGNHVNLDLDKRPHLNREGVLTRYDNGAWRPSCFNSELHNDTKRMEAGQKICDYFGFKNVDSTDDLIVKNSKLIERSRTKDVPVPYEYSPHFTPAKDDNKTCNGFYVRCKPILGERLEFHQRIDPKTNESTYTWPWEAAIFVDGKYHCSAVLLENNLLLSSSECTKDIDLHKNYTIALLGVSEPVAAYNSPYQQLSTIADIKPIKNSDAALFRLKDAANMTRYVEPLYLEKRIFPASKNDTCVALGVNENHERKMKLLQPVVENCPKCHRCYIDKEDASCSMTNVTSNWSGNVVCLSSGGWYPAAVFHDKDESCGFGTKQVLNSIDYIHAHLSQAIDENIEPAEEPFCEGMRCSTGKCITWDRVCDGVRHCQDGADENREHCQKMRDRCNDDIMDCKCTKAELRCGNGKCIPKEKFCDRVVNCDDGTDEPPSCSCGEYLKLTEPQRVCDGRRHCLDKSDESYKQCLCKDSSFKCDRSTYNGTVPCVPQDFVCDGEVDCPQGEDEAESTCWIVKNDRRDPKGKGEVMQRPFGVLQSECYPRPIQSQREVTNTCMRLGYTSGILVDGSKLADSQYLPRNDFYMFQLNPYMWMTMRPDESFGIWQKPVSSCYRLFVHCFI